MFTYKTAIARKKYVADRYIETDLESTRLMDVSSGYSAVYLILEHHLLPEPIAVDWSTLQDELRHYNPHITVRDWLELRGNADIVPMDYMPTPSVTYVQFRDAYEAGFDINPIDIGYPTDAPGDLSERKDLVLTKAGVDCERLYHYCLPTVAGLVHRPDATKDAYYIRDGNVTAVNDNTELVGLMSFETVGKLTYLDVTSDNVTKVDEIPLADSLIVDLGVPVADLVLGFVLNGYLHINCPYIRVVGETTISVEMRRFSLLERFFETHDTLEWDALNDVITRDADNPTHIAQAEFWSDDAMRSHFDHPQTFFFAVDTDNLFIEETVLEDTDLPRRYYTYEQPLYPLITEYGRLREYHALYEQGIWVIAVQDNKQRRYRFNTYDHVNYPTVDGNTESACPWQYSKAYMQLIGSETIRPPEVDP